MELQFMLNKEPLISIDNIISVPPAGDEIDYNYYEGPAPTLESMEEDVRRIQEMSRNRTFIVTHN